MQELLTIASLMNLAIINGLYTVGYAFLFGMSVWITFFGGVIAYRVLPRHQFGALQHKTFPVYFAISMLISFGLLLLWTFKHPDVRLHIANPLHADVAQVYVLGSAFLCQAINYFVISPMTSKTMFQRHKLEKEENKAYSDPGVSNEMKALNRRFGKLHGISSLANLFAVIFLGFHGFWIGNAGINGQ